jgi:SAM-dependent methyltransferase
MAEATTMNEKQYSDSRKLAARARLNSEYTVAEVPWFPWVAQQLSLKSRDRVLDIGCGPGWFWSEAGKAVPPELQLTLADLSPGMVGEAVSRCRELPFHSVEGRQADAMDLPFADGSFDFVLAMHMIYHLSDPSVGIAEMHRTLAPGGYLAVTTNGRNNMRELYEMTTIFGSPPHDPVAAVFGLETAENLMRTQFGNVLVMRHPARMLITEPEDVFLALTSYPPGDEASDDKLKDFREVIDEAFRNANGVIEVEKESCILISRKD